MINRLSNKIVVPYVLGSINSKTAEIKDNSMPLVEHQFAAALEETLFTGKPSIFELHLVVDDKKVCSIPIPITPLMYNVSNVIYLENYIESGSSELARKRYNYYRDCILSNKLSKLKQGTNKSLRELEESLFDEILYSKDIDAEPIEFPQDVKSFDMGPDYSLTTKIVDESDRLEFYAFCQLYMIYKDAKINKDLKLTSLIENLSVFKHYTVYAQSRKDIENSLLAKYYPRYMISKEDVIEMCDYLINNNISYDILDIIYDYNLAERKVDGIWQYYKQHPEEMPKQEQPGDDD